MNFFSKITVKGWVTIILVIVLLWLIIRYFKNKNTITTTTTTTVPNPNINTSSFLPSTTKDDSFPLGFGSRGENVKKWQTYLNSKGSTLNVDGVWGPLTDAASIKQTGFNSITEVYFKSVIK